MHHSADLEDIRQSLRNEDHAKFWGLNGKGLIAILLSRPQSPFAAAEVFPNLDYLHLRTGDDLQIFVAGASAYGKDESDAQPVVTRMDLRAYFSNRRFADMVRQIEAAFAEEGKQYRYSGGTELILVRVANNALDFDNAACMNVEKLLSVGGVLSFSELVEKLLAYSIQDEGLRSPERFLKAQLHSEPVSALIRTLLTRFGLGTREFDRRREWLVCDLENGRSLIGH